MSLMKRRKNKEVDTTVCFIYEVLTKIDKHHLYQQGQGTKKQRLHQSKCKGNRDKIWESHLSQKNERKRINDQLDPLLRGTSSG